MSDTLPTLVILAGGSSSRLWPLRDKSLITFLGKTLLERQIETYMETGFTRFVIICNPQNRDAIAAVIDGLQTEAQFQILLQNEAKGMGDALLSLKPLAGAFPVYVCQVHDVFAPALHQAMLQSYQSAPDVTWLAAFRVERYFPGGYLVLNEQEQIVDIIEKPAPGSEPSDLVNIVAHVHPDLDRLLQAIEAEYQDTSTTTDDHYERAMAKLMQTMPYRSVPYSGEWHPVKYPWHVLDVMSYYLATIQGQQIASSAKIEEGVSIVGPVIIGDNVRIFRGADIRGPVYIGAGSLVGQFAQVRHSMISNTCEIGLGSEVNRSYIGQGARLHSSKALDSILADSDGDQHVNLAAGAITANLRVDYKTIKTAIKGAHIDTGRDKFGAVLGAGAFVGINASLMPGVKLGEQSIVGPGAIVSEDVPDGQRVFVRQELVRAPRREKEH